MASLQVIGRYEVKSKIARGGMATVYHAYDPRFERDVAIKVLPEVFLHDPQFRVRFEREAKMIALLEHPAIVPVYDFGEESGMPYIVMRYMSGGSLTERIKNEPMGLAETAQMVFRLAPALDAAHARNIIHRDMKPGNILFDQYGNAYLSDFGIARLAESGSATLTGDSIIGTPAYMSPEQVAGERTIDGRSDLYSLGVLIYQMLAGQVPYQADTPAKVMMMHVLQPPPSILSVRPDLPPECETVLTRAMAKKPEDRYASTAELSAALEAIMHGTPGIVIPPTPVEPLADRAHRPDYQMTTVGTSGETRVNPGATVVSTATVAGAQKPGADATRVSAGKGGASVPPGGSATAVAETPSGRGGTSFLVPALIGVVVILLLAAGGLALMGRRGSGPLAMLGPSATPPPTATQVVPTATVELGGAAGDQNTDTPAPATDTPVPATTEPPATDTPAATEAPAVTAVPTLLPGGPVIGGADKIAFLNKNDIWVADLDGTDLEQLTDDNTVKENLQWTPDGEAVNYISGKCAYSVRLADQTKEILTCFNFAQYFKSFEISPDGKQVAISLDNQLYVLPYDLNKIRSVSVRADLTEIADCKHFAPYLKFFVKFPRWGVDAKTISYVMMGRAKDIGTADTIQLIDFTQCTPDPKILDNFPPPRFVPEEYALVPRLINFGWDGRGLFSLATFIRNQGFGKLYVYNSDLKKDEGPLNISGECCYRDPIFSPDGTHLLYAYQQYPPGTGPILLYMVPYGTLGTGESYAPLDLPQIDPKTMPVPALRPAR